MKKATTILLLVAMLLIVVGAAIFIIPLALGGWDFSALDGNHYQTKTYDITEEFTKVSIHAITSDVMVLPSTDGKVSVISREREKEQYEVKAADGALSVTLHDTSKWYDNIFFFGEGESSVKIYLPSTELASLNISVTTGDIFVSPSLTFGAIDINATTGDVEGMANATDSLRIHLRTGDVNISGIRAGKIEIESTTGDMELERIDCAGEIVLNTTSGELELSDITAASLKTEGTTGELEMMRVSIGGALEVKHGTGDVSFRALDSGSISIECTTGDVSGSVLKPMMFSAKSTTGDIRIPTPEAGGRCHIKTTTGDIWVTIE